MNDLLAPVLRALDAAPQTFFIRDDDAGWDDDRLFALLDTTAAAGVPIDLAAIPTAIGAPLARELNARIDAAPARLSVHQHGLAHLNHEAEGRKCEFGTGRSTEQQRADLVEGRERLREHFGARLAPWFTPPWNRIAPHTPALLAELGYRMLSRDRTAPPQAALPELAVDVDWTRHHREGGPAAVAAALATVLQPGRPLGLMLHHAVMAPAEFTLLGQWLRTLASHPHARWCPMGAALTSPTESPLPC